MWTLKLIWQDADEKWDHKIENTHIFSDTEIDSLHYPVEVIATKAAELFAIVDACKK